MTKTEIKKWSTKSFLTKELNKQLNTLIILNTPLPNLNLFKQIWSSSEIRFCADGGANRLYDTMKNSKENENEFIPNYIKGDLDSIRLEVKKYYSSKGVPIIHDPSQDSTDLGKCLESLVELEQTPPASHTINIQEESFQYQLIIIGGLSGRLDQTVHTLHALSLLNEQGRRYTWAVGRDSIACVLGKGKHEITTDLNLFGDTCAILPVIAGEAKVITTGLKWDVGPGSYAYPTSVATAVSTSNHLANEIIEVETDVPVVWTVEVRDGVE